MSNFEAKGQLSTELNLVDWKKRVFRNEEEAEYWIARNNIDWEIYNRIFPVTNGVISPVTVYQVFYKERD